MQHAIVIGSGMAGLLAARVLSNRAEMVTVIERDEPNFAPNPRRSLPQGNHAHLLLKRGELALERLFPGLMSSLEEHGSLSLDVGKELDWFHHGDWKCKVDGGLTAHLQSRPLLEWLIRRRVEVISNVFIRYRTSVSSLIWSGSSVKGVRLCAAGTHQEREELEADLVIDATGRGSSVPKWLQEEGFGAPQEERNGIQLQYASQTFARPPGDRTAAVIYQNKTTDTRAGIVFPIEGNRWQVTLIGYCGDHPSSKPEAFREFARSLAQPHIANVIENATPTSQIHVHALPYTYWRHYEQMKCFPKGLLCIGDSICGFDPVFGQGMTVAAIEAELLAETLDERAPLHTFFERAAKAIFLPWSLSTSEGQRYPAVTGHRPPGLSLVQAYNLALFRACQSSPLVYSRFLRVLHMLDGPETLFHPEVVFRVLWSAFTRKPAALPERQHEPEFVPLARAAGHRR